MADKNIHCHECGRFVGTLKEGSKIMVGLIHICPECLKDRNFSSSQSYKEFSNIFDNLFKK